MILYSYIFNVVYKGYRKSGDNHPGIYALGIISLLQFLTVIGVIMLPVRLRGEKFNGAKDYSIYIIILAVMLGNYIYYYKINNPKKISEKIEHLNTNKIKTLKILTLLHIVLTLGLIVFLINLPTIK